jgi:hypothetical protein
MWVVLSTITSWIHDTDGTYHDFYLKKYFVPLCPFSSKLFFDKHFFFRFKRKVQMKETRKKNQQVVKNNWKYSLQPIRRIQIHISLVNRNRFVFGCFGCQLTEEKCGTTEEKSLWERPSVGDRVEDSISSFFPPSSQDTVVKGTKDRNQVFLSTQRTSKASQFQEIWKVFRVRY